MTVVFSCFLETNSIFILSKVMSRKLETLKTPLCWSYDKNAVAEFLPKGWSSFLAITFDIIKIELISKTQLKVWSLRLFWHLEHFSSSIPACSSSIWNFQTWCKNEFLKISRLFDKPFDRMKIEKICKTSLKTTVIAVILPYKTLL